MINFPPQHDSPLASATVRRPLALFTRSLLAIPALIAGLVIGLAASVAEGADSDRKNRTAVNGFTSGSLSASTGERLTFKLRVRTAGKSTKRRVKLQRKVAGSWRTTQKRRTTRAGRVTLNWRAPGKATSTKLRVLVPATRKAKRKTSRARRVVVTSQAKTPDTQIRTYLTHPYEDEVFRLLNRARSTATVCAGKRYPAVKPLRRHPMLDRAARGHSRDMGQRRFFDHTNPDGRTPTDRARVAGFRGSVGENIAAGQRTPAEVTQAWLDSPAHCVNLMRPGYEVVGIGYANEEASRYGSYWTQNFG